MAIKHIKIGSTTLDVNDARNVVIGDGVNNIVKCTLAQYNALATKDANTVYIPTDAPAVPAGGGSSDNIFVATYGTTTYAEIVSAINLGKIVCATQPSGADGMLLLYSGGLTSFPDDLIFTQLSIENSYVRGQATWVAVTSSDVWSHGTRQLLSENSVVTSVSSSSTDSKVPSAKCLYTALQTKQNTINANNKLSYSYISGTPTELPASDVYAWAKASTKPTYTASEVGAQEAITISSSEPTSSQGSDGDIWIVI